jgi:hypothetical protein
MQAAFVGNQRSEVQITVRIPADLSRRISRHINEIGTTRQAFLGQVINDVLRQAGRHPVADTVPRRVLRRVRPRPNPGSPIRTISGRFSIRAWEELVHARISLGLSARALILRRLQDVV